jgi:ribosomal 50S subunit-associated protein YjgA (DUF615 family)
VTDQLNIERYQNIERNHQEVLKRFGELQGDVKVIVSKLDLAHEIHQDQENRIRSLEKWRNGLAASLGVLVTLAGAIWHTLVSAATHLRFPHG